MFPVALQRLRVSLRGGVALAVEFATLGELVLEHPEPELRGGNQDRSSAGRLIGEHRRPAVRPLTAAARAQLLAKQPASPAADEDYSLATRGTVTAVEPQCAEARVRAPSREPRRRRPQPDAPQLFCE